MVTPEKVKLAIERIVEMSEPRKLILFGSYIRGGMTIHSDQDVLVVTSDRITSSRQESVRIRQSLRGISMPMDIIVVSESRFHQLADVPGLVFNEANKNGRVVYQAA